MGYKHLLSNHMTSVSCLRCLKLTFYSFQVLIFSLKLLLAEISVALKMKYHFSKFGFLKRELGYDHFLAQLRVADFDFAPEDF